MSITFLENLDDSRGFGQHQSVENKGVSDHFLDNLEIS